MVQVHAIAAYNGHDLRSDAAQIRKRKRYRSLPSTPETKGIELLVVLWTLLRHDQDYGDAAHDDLRAAHWHGYFGCTAQTSYRNGAAGRAEGRCDLYFVRL